MIRYELFKIESHYEEISKWWAAQRWSVVPLSHLPEIGIVVYQGEKMACAAWIYKTDSAFCILDMFVANPEIRKDERNESINYLFDVSKNIIKELGFQSIYTMTSHSSLISRLEKNGFVANDSNMSSLIFNINKGGL